MTCSKYKITFNGKTIVGCYEDAWRTTSKKWFVNAKKNVTGFIGSRQVDLYNTVTQSGMNEMGRTFFRLSVYFPEKNTPL